MSGYKDGYLSVNGLQMYYQAYGEGYPLLLIHGGGSTIETSFRHIIPILAKRRKVIAMDMQAHGRTGDRDSPLSFEQDAKDIAELMRILKIERADILGFSNGGQTAIELAISFPASVNRVIIASALFDRTGAIPEFWNGFQNAKIEDMPADLKSAYLQINGDVDALLNMFNKDVERMKNFQGWSEKQLSAITAHALVINGNKDVGSIEHAVQLHRLIPNSELLVVPGGHGDYFEPANGEASPDALPTVTFIENFLSKP